MQSLMQKYFSEEISKNGSVVYNGQKLGGERVLSLFFQFVLPNSSLSALFKASYAVS